MLSRSRLFAVILTIFASLVLAIDKANADEYPVVSESCVTKIDVLILTPEMGWVVQRLCGEQIATPEEIRETVKLSI